MDKRTQKQRDDDAANYYDEINIPDACIDDIDFNLLYPRKVGDISDGKVDMSVAELNELICELMEESQRGTNSGCNS